MTCAANTLVPGISTTCTATYVVTQSDIDGGVINNTATASATPPAGVPAISNTDSETVLALSNPSIGLAKSANPTTVTAAGQMVTYSFVVTNTGNVTLAGVSVSDPLPGLTSINCPVSTLAPGSSTVCTPGYVVTQADINAGAISNTATVAGTPKAGSAVGAADANTVVAAATPAILIVKSTNPSVVTAAGQNVGYSFVVTSPTSIAA